MTSLALKCLRCAVTSVTAIAFVFCAAPLSTQAQVPLPRAIAVLPLANVSGDATQDFFAEGLTDELAVALAGMRGVEVVGRSSSFRFQGPKRDIAAIGRAAQCELPRPGYRASLGGPHRLEVSLVQARDGTELWSKDYDARRDDIFDVEADVARQIAAALNVPAMTEAASMRGRVTDVDVYLDFLRAKAAARPRGAKALADAAAILETVVVREPDFAPAAALLAYSYALTPLFAPSLRAGMPEEERKIVEQRSRQRCACRAMPPRSTRKARKPSSRSAMPIMVQRHMAGGGGCVPASPRTQPEPGRWAAWLEPASGRDGPHQGSRSRCASICRRSSRSSPITPRHRGDLLARRRYREGDRDAQAVQSRTDA